MSSKTSRMDIAINAFCLALGALGIYGLTRHDRAASWGRWLAGCSFAILLVLQISAPRGDDRCFTDWDGHGNPTVCR